MGFEITFAINKNLSGIQEEAEAAQSDVPTLEQSESSLRVPHRNAPSIVLSMGCKRKDLRVFLNGRPFPGLINFFFVL